MKEAPDEERPAFDFFGDGLLIKKVLLEGKGAHTHPNSGDLVTLRVDGQLDNNKHVDEGEVSFVLHYTEVIEAFDLAVPLMELGEKSELKTASKYAYGPKGRQPDIPEDANITYTLELLQIEPSDIRTLQLKQEEQFVEYAHLRGNFLFMKEDYLGALKAYNKVIQTAADKACVNEIRLKCHKNLAACYLKTGEYDKAIISCNRVLEEWKDDIKALYRLGKAYKEKGNLELALHYLHRARKLNPCSLVIEKELQELDKSTDLVKRKKILSVLCSSDTVLCERRKKIVKVPTEDKPAQKSKKRESKFKEGQPSLKRFCQKSAQNKLETPGPSSVLYMRTKSGSELHLINASETTINIGECDVVANFKEVHGLKIGFPTGGELIEDKTDSVEDKTDTS